MKKSFHVFFLFVLFAFFAVNAAWAATLCPDPLQEDANGGCYINLPKEGEGSSFSIPDGVTSFKVYDDGGSAENYGDNSDGYLLLTAPEGCTLEVTGDVWIEKNWDALSIYDGTSNNDNALLEDFCSEI